MCKAARSVTIVIALTVAFAMCTSSAFAASKWILKDRDASISKVGYHDAHIRFTKKSDGENYRIAYAKAGSKKWRNTDPCGKKYAKKSGKAKFYTGCDYYLKDDTKYKVKFQVRLNGKWVTAKNTKGSTFVKTFTTREDSDNSRGGEALPAGGWY